MRTSYNRADGIAVQPLESLSAFIEERIKEHIEKLADRLTASAADLHVPIGVQDAAKILRISTSRVYVLSNNGQLPCHRRGGRLYFFRDELTDLVRSHDSSKKIVRTKKKTATS